MDRRVNNHKSSIFNYDANVLSFLIYLVIMVGNFIPFLNYFIFALPLIIYVMENKSDFVRGHALQAFVISFFSSIFSLLCLLVSFVAKPRCNATLSFCFGSSIIHKMFSMFGSIRWMFCGFIFVVCLVLALRSYNYESYKLEYVDKFIDKIGRFLNRLLGVIPIGEEKKEEVTEEVSEPVEESIAEEPVKHETVRERKKKKRIQRELEETMRLKTLEEEKKEEPKKETVRERKKKKRIQRELEETMKIKLEEVKTEEEPVKKPVTKKKTNNQNRVTKKSLLKTSNKAKSKKNSSKGKSKTKRV